MSSRRETVERVYEAFSRGDIPAVLAQMDPQVEWLEPASLPFEDQVGPQAVAENVFALLPSMFSEFSLECTEVLDAGDAVVSLGAYRGTGSRTGARLEADFAHVWRFGPDGKVTSFRLFTDTHRWLEVLGSGPEATVPAQASSPSSTTPV